ncbi:hypothetical protein Q6348_10305 [Isoptericola sp. b441]|uniref:Uncharacterized protein n=1 Tax=Actinotalea lenta TaxID=3064654 RepID=A0ABT9DAQ4_9CELL|nr:MULTISPECIES: hypothetical protein [unclassified Isoptericola]MDO8107586.1 hypothetical protein [Isoptericola sp. b441]MDO8120754.1 hypothetical protein [Isoptericola sp. b490]
MVTQIPESLPVLGPGAHRRPRDGGCFMEWASLLAGERWSDHPRCTHPLLAHLARAVNDVVDDRARQRLAPWIPAVVGLTGGTVRWDLEIALLVTRRAIGLGGTLDVLGPLAAGLLTVDRALATVDGRTGARLRPGTRDALDQVPAAAAWAREWTEPLGVPRSGYHDLSRAAVDRSLAVLASHLGPGRDALLVEVLTDAIEVCARLAGRSAPRRVQAGAVA